MIPDRLQPLHGGSQPIGTQSGGKTSDVQNKPTGALGDQSVEISKPMPMKDAPVSVGRPRAQAVSVPTDVKPREVGADTGNTAKGILLTADELKQSIGADPKSDIGVGFLKRSRSSEYKQILTQLSVVHDVVSKATTTTGTANPALSPPIRKELGGVIGALQTLDSDIQLYVDAKKTTHKPEMAEFQKAVQQQIKLLQGLDQHLASGKPWPPNLDVQTALQYLRANPDLSVEEMGLAAQHGLTEQDVAAFAKAKVPLREGCLPQGGQIVGEPTKLGSGATATVYKVQFQPTQGPAFTGVFKAESTYPDPASDIGIDRKQPNFPSRSVATYKLDQALKLGLVPQTEVVMHDGQLGTVMAMAKGRSPLHSGDFTLKLTPEVAAQYKKDPELLKEVAKANKWLGAEMVGDDLRAINSYEFDNFDENGVAFKSTKEKDTVVLTDMKDPDLRRELTKLQWLDALTGQVDRHAHNYFVHRGSDGKMHVTAIDNDLSFGKNTLKGNDIRNNPDKGLNRFHGGKLPQVIDKDTRDALMGMTADDLHQQLDGLLSPDEVSATISRLNDIQQHIATLDEGGRVYDSNYEWTTREADDWLGIPNTNLVDRDIRISGKPFDKNMQALNRHWDVAQDGGYVARESLMIHLAMTQNYAPTTFQELMK